ncbi:MAG TPA: hypothetical protein VKA43_11215 [Gammaproteobacteria bacterium]|nr:hypothetical protein [Gammaproteobacteria bacterium]
MRAASPFALIALLVLAACAPDTPAPSAGPTASAELVPAERAAKVALGLTHGTARDLYDALKARAGGGAPLSLDDMPDWTGLWTRVGRPFFDPEQPADALTTAKLKPEPLAELTRRRELSAQGIEYDPISDCSPPGYPRWLAIPFLRELIVTPGQTLLFSETVNNLRRVYTDGRDHPPLADAYPLHYGDSIGFWSGHTLVIHTSQVTAGIFHRNDPQYSESLEAVEVWRKTDPTTVLVDVWVYDPLTLDEPWYVQQTYKQVPNPDGSLRIGYWHCGENPNNLVEQTSDGTSQFSDFTFTDRDDR